MDIIYPILTQPDCVTCGPTCLQSIYSYYQDSISLEDTIKQIEFLPSGGTLAVLLGCHALKRGYRVTLHSFNVFLLDPTWFRRKNVSLLKKLKEQALNNKNTKIVHATNAYIQFLELGGKIIFTDFSFEIMKDYLDKKIPLLSGINATYYYQNMRDYTNQEDRAIYDEFMGEPSGHFVVIYDADDKQNLSIADPYVPHPISRNHHYKISYNHWLHALLLGISTFDAEILSIQINR